MVIDSGFWTTVQDYGRVGYREWGVPTGGAFDRSAADLANALVGNGPECAVLELTLRGGMLEALGSVGIALAGAPIEASVVATDGSPRRVRVPSSCSLHAGERLVLGRTLEGARTYLAVRGGFQTPLRLGSRSSEQP
ncbi:MAG TPA: allophanate hydrolase, partial [Isosphaeraceae bacterium]|nr:allophanate hydrolase [Isosphaeraceae bacterium]